MKKVLISALFIACSFTISACASSANTADYDYKTIADFKTLESFEDIEDFEKSYKPYIQDCLDNTGGGSGAVSCFISYEMWDRELNIYYNKLMNALPAGERQLLKDSQHTWLKSRDTSIKLNSMIMSRYYPELGTMYIAMAAGDFDQIITPLIKNRALMFREWAKFKRTFDDDIEF